MKEEKGPKGIFPTWTQCPNEICGHHEMAHRHEMGLFLCTVFLCECPGVPSSVIGEQ